MDDHLWVGKSSRYVTGHLGKLSLPSLWVGYVNTGLWLELRQGVFTCVGWQLTQCDPIWQVTSCSSEMEFH